jgi:tRNA(Ile)-lysidine synthase
MLRRGEHVLVAVSGGADSTALLLCLHFLAPKYRLSLSVGHLNHRIRGSEGDSDEEFVRRMSADLGWPFYSEIAEVKQQAVAAKKNLEELARQRRYDFLRRTALRINAQKIAVGHTLNDQAETVLLQLLRGSGLEGLSAIHPVVDGFVIRPLLECSRQQILEYLNSQRTCHREDSTNFSLQHRRNRIRHELIPYLEKNFNPKLAHTLAREAELAREIYALMESQGRTALEAVFDPIDQDYALKTKEILGLHPALQRQVIRLALRKFCGSLRGITALHVEKILSLCSPEHSGRRIRLPHGSIALRQFDRLLFLEKEPALCPAFSYKIKIPGRCVVPEAKACFSTEVVRMPGPGTVKEDYSRRVFLNSAALPDILTIRSRIAGDRYGGPGHRKVKKMLIDRKIPLSQRSALPMVVAEDSVVWIPGFKPAKKFESTAGSKNCVILEISYSDENK